jgi:hypothetical protein
MTMPAVRSSEESPAEARLHIAWLAGLALLVAGLVFVMFVLPAEFAVDPLGTGARLGLLDLGRVGKQVEAFNAAASTQTANTGAPIVAPREKPFHHETVEFALAPREFVEYKYRLDKGDALLYSWTSTGAVDVELHAEPDGAPRGYAQSYEKRSAVRSASGTLTAPFAGIHGWYWENLGDQPITVTLESAGFYTLAHEFRKDQPVRNKTF